MLPSRTKLSGKSFYGRVSRKILCHIDDTTADEPVNRPFLEACPQASCTETLRYIAAFLKGQGHVMQTNPFQNDDLAVFRIVHSTVIFHYFSQNERTCYFEDGLLYFVEKQTNADMLYDCRHIGVSL